MGPTTLKRQRGSVLAVNASVYMQRLLQRLEEGSYRAIEVSGGQDALALLETASVDLILLNTQTPDVGSYELCNQLKHNPSTCAIPVVFVSPSDTSQTNTSQTIEQVSGEDLDRINAFRTGAADYLSESLPLADALTRLNHHLAVVSARRHAQPQPLEQPTQQWDKPHRDATTAGNLAGSTPQRSELTLPQAAIANGKDMAQPQQAGMASTLSVGTRVTQQQRITDLDGLLKRIVYAIWDSLDEDQILQTTIEELGQGLGLTYGNAALYRPNGHPAKHYEYVSGEIQPQPDFRTHADIQSVQRSLLNAAKSRPQHSDPSYRRGPHLNYGIIQFCCSHPDWGQQLVLICPILDRQSTLGDLLLLRSADHETMTAQEISLIQHISNQCAAAIRQTRLYRAAQAQVELLEELHRQKDAFLSAVSHELRSPVTNMKMAIQMLTMCLGLQSDSPSTQMEDTSYARVVPKVRQYLQILNSECDREIGLINDLLDLQRFDSGIQSPNVGLISLESWFMSVVEAFEERTQARQQRLQLQCLTPIASFRTDITAVHRILTELLDNAHRYTPPGETIQVTARMVDHALRLQVTNSGTEIPANHLPYIFDKFHRVPSNNRWQTGGTGLGLALVKHLVHYLGGTVQVHSEQGKTSFRVMLPEMAPPS